MGFSLKPILLLADSQLLFWGEDGTRFVDSVRGLLPEQSPKAAYVGASNGDEPTFYALFEDVMDGIGVRNRRMITSDFPDEDASFVEEADLILLAGGEVERGARVLEENGLKEQIIRRYYEGAVLIGISAGAVQLGVCGWPATGLTPDALREMFGLAPFIISAHDEKLRWEELKSAVQLMGGKFSGIGIPSGGGAIYYPDHSIEPVRYGLYNFHVVDDEVTCTLLMPSSGTTRSGDSHRPE